MARNLCSSVMLARLVSEKSIRMSCDCLESVYSYLICFSAYNLVGYTLYKTLFNSELDFGVCSINYDLKN